MILIKKATEKDVLLEEWHQMDKPHYGKSIEWNEKRFRFKAIEDGKLIGTVSGKHESGVVYIEALMTAKNFRGRGVGTKLIEKAEKFGKNLGAHRTWLVTGKDWSENTFYRKLGFELIGNLPDLYFHKDFVIYTRRIQ